MQSLSIRWSIQWYCKLQNILPIFHVRHFTINCICLMLLLHKLKQVLILVKQFSFINRNVSQADTLHMVQHFPFSCLQQKNLVKTLKYKANKVVHLSWCATQDLYNRNTSDMNKSQSRSLLSSPNFFSAYLTWLDTYIWYSLNCCLYSGATRYNHNN